MSRPKPTILLQNVSSSNYKTLQVLDADAVYAVFYKGKPVNLRSLEAGITKPAPKYLKSSFPNAGHCFNLAEKLNRTFKCMDFSVVMLVDGEPIDEDDV